MICSRSGDKCLTLPKYALDETLDRQPQHALFLNPTGLNDPNTKFAIKVRASAYRHRTSWSLVKGCLRIVNDEYLPVFECPISNLVRFKVLDNLVYVAGLWVTWRSKVGYE